MTRLKFDYKLPIDKIDVSFSNARKTNLEEGIDELAKSIKEIGVQQPVTVCKKSDGRFELIIGQRRYLACNKLGLKVIPAIITTVKDETDATIKSFSENIHRLDLEYRDKMAVATELVNKLGSEKKVADQIGVVVQTVRNWLGYADVSEDIKEIVDGGTLSATTALRIWRNIPNKEQALKIAKKVEETPRTEVRHRIINVARENPDKSPEEIVKMVRQLKPITIHVTQKVYNALTNASKKYDSHREDIITDVVEEWLKKRGFLE